MIGKLHGWLNSARIHYNVIAGKGNAIVVDGLRLVGWVNLHVAVE
ncbi:MAG: hypothetical protein R3F28_15445 [Candidatus Kapaibacterium sp.]